MTAPDLQAEKQNMLRRQLRARGIHDRSVLAAMERVPRERFVLDECRREAYADRALAIRCGQTISQPFIVGLMTQALELSGEERVLEIGTGSGYQTAILAELAQQVFSIERHGQLSETAGKRLEDLSYRNVTLKWGDGTLGWTEHAPYDRIMVTATAVRCPPALFEQLSEQGIIVMPVGGEDYQVLQAIRKVEGAPRTVNLSPCRFVPLVGAQGWPE